MPEDALTWTLRTELFGNLELPSDPTLRPPEAEILARARELVSRSKSKQTLRAYRTGWRQWCDFCDRMGYQTLANDPQAVALFLAHLSRTKKLSTVRSRLAAISAAYKVVGLPIDLGHSSISSVVMGFRREQALVKPQQATPLLWDAIPKFLSAFDASRAKGARDRALILIGFGGALRRSELVALDAQHVEITGKGLILHLQRSKTDQYGDGDLVAIHRSPEPLLCPTAALEHWLEFRGREPGPLFTRVIKGGRVMPGRLSDEAVSLVIKEAAEIIGFDPRLFSGHSLRAGLATSAALEGADIVAIMQQTRHKSVDIARRYIRTAEIWRNNVTERLFAARQFNSPRSAKPE